MIKRILLLVPFIFFLTITIGLRRERIELLDEIGSEKAELSKLLDVKAVSEEDIQRAETGYFWGLSRYRKEKNLNLFAQSIKDELLKKKLRIIEYQRLDENDEEFIEFTVEGRPLYFFEFLDSITAKAHAFRIPQFSLNIQDSNCRISFRIGFDVINRELESDLPLTEGYEWAEEVHLSDKAEPGDLEKLFYIPPKPKPAPAMGEPVRNPPVIQRPIAPLEFLYIGKVTVDSQLKYYLKEETSGKVYTVPSDNFALLDAGREAITFKYHDTRYEVDLQ